MPPAARSVNVVRSDKLDRSFAATNSSASSLPLWTANEASGVKALMRPLSAHLAGVVAAAVMSSLNPPRPPLGVQTSEVPLLDRRLLAAASARIQPDRK